MKFIISCSKWDGYSYWYDSCGCAIGQTLRQQGCQIWRGMDSPAMLRWARARKILWLTPQLVDDLSQSSAHPIWDADTQDWLRKTLAAHGHTLTVKP